MHPCPGNVFQLLVVATLLALPRDRAGGGEVAPPTCGPLEAGDANQNLEFDHWDLVLALEAGRFRDAAADPPVEWYAGDWNGAPGGEVGHPPLGDGKFDDLDVIAAWGNGLYSTGAYNANWHVCTVDASAHDPGRVSDESTESRAEGASGNFLPRFVYQYHTGTLSFGSQTG